MARAYDATECQQADRQQLRALAGHLIDAAHHPAKPQLPCDYRSKSRATRQACANYGGWCACYAKSHLATKTHNPRSWRTTTTLVPTPSTHRPLLNPQSTLPLQHTHKHSEGDLMGQAYPLQDTTGFAGPHLTLQECCTVLLYYVARTV
jgi:hypothetical protein